MNKAFFLQLVFNASLLLTLVLIYDLIAVRWQIGRAAMRQVPVGVVISFMGVIVILASWKMQPGIVFDTRSILLGISGLFFGTVPTTVAMVFTAAFRASMGGPAAGMGIAVIFTSGVIGIAWRRMRRPFLADITWRELYLFGLIIHLAMLGWTFILPGATRWQVLSNIVLPVLLVYPVVTAVLGKLLADHLKREITIQKLRESEERYQTLANISPVGIFRTDQSGATTYVNPMWCRISGLSEAEAMGEGWLAAVHPDDRESLHKGWQETIRLQKPSLADYRFLRPDGTEGWVMGQATPEQNSEHQIIGYVGTITDISERKRAEEVIRASLAEKEVLLKEVHHRVKNNLMTIIGLINMQEAKANNEMFNPLLQELEGRVRSMALVHESLHKSESLARIDLQNYIETLTAHIRAQFGAERDIRFRVQAVGVEVNLDIAVPCGLILNELITNACKHAFPGGKPRAGEDNCEITIFVKKDDRVCMLTITDNGVGLPEGLNLENPETLGLKLIKMLSQQINGSIELDRSAGTTFHLRFAHSSAAS
ncbi:MAG: PAS domain S-box protein [Candidatus Aminicenantes bacterium]|nr:PAS domain S-box protein [Acidobacteriota bacterium]MBU4404835.1 PAS domain S-box protein [Acidobacteriota bacterium]MCG2812597.1 PAS domain S-box protein [Candidatus Aminicenantes bacterium]